ncbi:hypothetical protein [Amycolatopsis minnesotensis]|uniref:Uncharacterized protein n=1 Tax=Amycolatopsis minnesotensis TaxID=337894 RepID=A0ABP5C6G3_9PSEU
MDAVDLVALPASRFGAAAMALVWSNILVENAREDLTGALDRGQWRVAELIARRMTQVSLRALLSAHGVSPLPPDSELVRGLGLLGADGREFEATARGLERPHLESEAAGRAALAELDAFVAAVRARIGASAFPDSFATAEAWRATLDIGYDWLRLGGYLDAELPIDEARDLLASGGSQPHLAG